MFPRLKRALVLGIVALAASASAQLPYLSNYFVRASGVSVGYTTNEGYAGAIRWNGSLTNLQVFNGLVWTNLSTSSGDGSGFPLTTNGNANGYSITNGGTFQANTGIFSRLTGANIFATTNLDVDGYTTLDGMRSDGNVIINGDLTVNGTEYNNTVIYNSTNLYIGTTTNYVSTTIYSSQVVYQTVITYSQTNIITTNTVITYVNIGGTWDSSNTAWVATPHIYDPAPTSGPLQALGGWSFSNATVYGLDFATGTPLYVETDPTFANWLATGGVIIAESDPVYSGSEWSTNSAAAIIAAAGGGSTSFLTHAHGIITANYGTYEAPVNYPDLAGLPTNDPDGISTWFDTGAGWTNFLPIYTNGYTVLWTNGNLAVYDPGTVVARWHGWLAQLSATKTQSWQMVMSMRPARRTVAGTGYGGIGITWTNATGLCANLYGFDRAPGGLPTISVFKYATLAAAGTVSSDVVVPALVNNTIHSIMLRLVYSRATTNLAFSYAVNAAPGLPPVWQQTYSMHTVSDVDAVGLYAVPYNCPTNATYIDFIRIGSYP